MPDDSNWKRLSERDPAKEQFVTRARHIHRFGRVGRVNDAKREAERDRVIFLWVMAVLIAVGIVVAVGVFLIRKQA